MKNILCLAIVAIGATAFANAKNPQVTNVQIKHNPGSAVKISYSLDEQAYVTMDILTNGVSIGAENIISGIADGSEVQMLVAAGSAKSITWKPRVSWPEHQLDDGSLSVRVVAWATDCPPQYLAMDMATGKIGCYPSADFVPGGVTNDVYKTTKLLIRKIEAAGRTFLMGAPIGEFGRVGVVEGCVYGTYGHPGTVMLTNDYYIGVYEMTQRQVQYIDNTVHGTYTKSGAWPADGCSWDVIRGGKFYAGGADNAIGTSSHMAWLRKKSGNLLPFDLPTEAQWEYACRAGTTTALYSGYELSDLTNDTELAKIAWYAGNGGIVNNENKGPTKVGSFAPNAWGLYDMLGNLGEQCLDRCSWNQAPLPMNSRIVNVNPCGWREDEQSGGGAQRRLRGGSWETIARACRCGARSDEKDDRGKDATSRSGNWASGYRVCVTF